MQPRQNDDQDIKYRLGHLSPRLRADLNLLHANAETSPGTIPTSQKPNLKPVEPAPAPQKQARRSSDLRAMFGAAPTPADGLTPEEQALRLYMSMTQDERRVYDTVAQKRGIPVVDAIVSALHGSENRVDMSRPDNKNPAPATMRDGFQPHI